MVPTYKRCSVKPTHNSQVRGSTMSLVFSGGSILALVMLSAISCVRAGESSATTSAPAAQAAQNSHLEVATFGSGCFWCTEAVFERVKGVKQVVSGYSGGFVPNPSYRAVCTGRTGHAEVVQLTYDPNVITYPELLEIFWKTHDPTTRNRQGPDRGPQYRSVVFYHNEKQKEFAESYKKQLNESNTFRRPIVTEVTKFTNFYPAEKYHQDYYELKGRQPYCRRYISPKIKKFNRVFRDKLKERK